MQPFTTITSKAAPLPIKDVDTDMIIPAQFLTSISREGFGANLFMRLKAADPEFFLNQERFKGAQILVGDSNFGCGSSREHAVWALIGAGIRVVIAKSFADIFASNSGKNGLLLVTLEAAVVDALLEEVTRSDLHLSVDLATQSVSDSSDRGWSFTYDPFLKHCMLNGLDDMEYLRTRIPQIEEAKAKQKQSWFFSVGAPNR
ncbi:MAG: 3-isopropylmalate dehydratase, small subunit [Pseudomonadota bacterium]|jgi:3-isopropylmalate/(R)-2-methylmalate dehydratase small subunit